MDGGSTLHGPPWFVSRDPVAPHVSSRRLRRLPTAAELQTLSAADSEPAVLGPDGPVVVAREYAEAEPTLLLGRERFGSVDESFSQAVDDRGDQPLAHASGRRLRPAAQGGAPEHATLTAALDHTSRHAPADRGITYVSGGRAVFESYATLRREAGRMLGGLRSLGLAPRNVVALQLVELQLHLRAVWACALGGVPSVTIAVAPQLTPQNAVAAKLVAAVAQLGVRHVLASDALLAPLEALLPPSARVLGASRLQQAASEAPCEACEAAVISDGDVLCYQLTSGSTGTPKAVPETHAAVIAHIRHSAQDCG